VNARVSRLQRLVGELKTFYGALPAPPSDAFTLFVWEILSGHTTPRRREAAVAALKRHRALTPDGIWNVAQKTLAASVALAGPYTAQRILALRKGVDVFRRHPDLPATISGPLPAAMRALKALPRMTGDSNAYRMLLFAGNQPVLPVDAKVSRVATRLGYGDRTTNFSKTAKTIRQAVSAELPESLEAYRSTYMYFDHHGATTCRETDPHCDDCPLKSDCPYGAGA
jgi:endonuclease III